MTPPQASLGTRITAALCAALLAVPSSVVSSPGRYPQSAAQTTPAKIPNDQLDSLVAPIALYPDPLLAQTLAASTYPLEIIQLQQLMTRHPDLKGEALAAAVEKENWDPAVQGLAGLPDVVKRLGDDIQWTTDLGNAFLAQQSDVMDAVQRMREKAADAGNLKTTEQQKVTTEVVQTKEVIVIQQANPQVIYVPATTRSLSTGLRFIPIRRSTTHPRATTLRVSRSGSASAWQWARSGGAAAGATARGGDTAASIST
jgi:hypothetical protein